MLLILNIIATSLELISLSTIPLFITVIIDPINLKLIPIVGPFLDELIIIKKLDYERILFYSSISLVFVFLVKNLFLFFLILFETQIAKNLKITFGLKLFKFYVTQPIFFSFE